MALCYMMYQRFTRSPAARAVPNNAAAMGKWEGEDEDDDGPSYSDWEASSEDDEVKPAATAAAPPKKKGTLKQKLAEKEAARRAQLAAGSSDADYDEDAVLDPHAKAQLEKERELESDLHNATELFGSSTLGCVTAGDFVALSEAIIAHIVKRHHDKPLYSTFVEHHVRALAMPLRDVDREKKSGKKPKAAAKPVLGASEAVCGEALDDIGPNADDFMK
ncbi:translation initiation factor eIF3 subunit [Lactarius sanguifluus]|nr:translation initiation factor eIF3 subunit [Lactarius sanguifluus]